ncbi:hypothetical protein BC827DRAFT_1188051 [Russula dissimulans]|nr:hypothetical protein BC827DRAFT_1188051 [Russula dissimulans]
MASIGPHVPAHLLARNAVQIASSTAEQPETGPSVQGPPAHAQTPSGSATATMIIPLAAAPALPIIPRYEEEEEDDEDEDGYTPELPPDLAEARANPNASGARAGPASVAPAPARRMIGPARGPFRREEEEEESGEEEIGPAPPPPPSVAGRTNAREDAVAEFLQKEAQRRQAIEEAARPKTLQRDEWMLVPPAASDLLSTLDPTKLNKPRQFSRSTAPAKVVDNTLWTETPAERQQRLADEVMGKKRRVENADLDRDDADADVDDEDARKRRKREVELQRQVDEYTRTHRGSSLLESRAQEEAKRKKGVPEEPAAIWDHARDMALGGRLMDEKDRRRIIQDARGLEDRFGASKGGSFL